MPSRPAALVLPAILGILVGLLVAFWPRVRETLRPPAPPPPPAAPPAAPPAEPETGPLDFPVAPAPAASSGSLFVKVTLDGLPLKGARVSVQREGTPQVRDFLTNESGGREIQGMPPAGYSVSAAHPDYLPVFGRADITAGRRSEVALEVRRGGKVFGRVTDAAGAPLPDTNVYLVDAQTKVTLGDAMKARTGADGRYVLPPIHTGEFGVRFRNEKYMVADRYGVNVVTGTESYEIDMALESGAMISGRVTDDQGLPLADVSVHAFTQGYGSIVVTDGDGRFAVHGLLDQTVVAVARRNGYGTVFARNIRPNTKDVEIRLPRAGILAGAIVADPLPETFAVTVARYDEELRRVIRVDTRMFDTANTGAAFQVPDLTPTVYWVEVEAPGYEALDQPQAAVLADQIAAGIRVRLRKK